MVLVVLGRRKPDQVTPYTMAQVEDHAYGEQHVREVIEREAAQILFREYDGIPVRRVWLVSPDHRLPPPEMLEALADGARIPWDTVGDTDLTGESGT